MDTCAKVWPRRSSRPIDAALRALFGSADVYIDADMFMHGAFEPIRIDEGGAQPQ